MGMRTWIYVELLRVLDPRVVDGGAGALFMYIRVKKIELIRL